MMKFSKHAIVCIIMATSMGLPGLPVNTTLALQMPTACNINAKVSDCPSILNIPADSPDAKIFKEADGSSSATSSTPASSSSSSSTMPSITPAGSGSGAETKTTTSSNSGAKLSGFLLAIMALMSTALTNI